MLMEYYDTYGVRNNQIFPKTIRLYEKYIQEKEIEQWEYLEKIDEFIETLPYTKATKKNYKAGLRIYIEDIARENW